jgi:hypothetical protein
MLTPIDRVLVALAPGELAGITFRNWVRLLRDNGFAVSPRYALRLFATTMGSLPNSVAARYEDSRYTSQIDGTRVVAPLFILGHWRSGTTHLHNLLALDDRFAFPTLYEVMYPHTFLTTERIGSRLLAPLLTRRRYMDNMEQRWHLPHEDEFALCIATSLSPYMSFAFPHRRAHYDRYLTLRDVDPEELDRWRSAVLQFYKKLTWKYGRPLIIKSPTHTARIKLLLEMFPEARFVHIHRDPYAIVQSTRHMHRTGVPHICLQRPDPIDADTWILKRFKAMYDAFFEERTLIPAGQYHEIRFEEIESDPIGQIENLYATLSLPDFVTLKPRLENYQRSVESYRKNRHTELPADVRAGICRELHDYFEAWHYAR